MIRRLVCVLRGHRPVPVRARWPMVMPDRGAVMVYEADPDGDERACSRCGLVPLAASPEEGKE